MKTLITIIFIGLISFTPVIPEKKMFVRLFFLKKKFVPFNFIIELY